MPVSEAEVRAAPEPGSRIYPRSRFLARFLAPFAIWHLATGAFNPFGNVYFSKLGFPVQQIGDIFSFGQVVQVFAVLCAPLVIRRFGLVNGIVWMMAATAFGLGGLATKAPGAAAVLGYAVYMAFQWMSEPGLNSLLMNHVNERERGGASALNYLVAFGAQALAAFGAGRCWNVSASARCWPGPLCSPRSRRHLPAAARRAGAITPISCSVNSYEKTGERGRLSRRSAGTRTQHPKQDSCDDSIRGAAGDNGSHQLRDADLPI